MDNDYKDILDVLLPGSDYLTTVLLISTVSDFFKDNNKTVLWFKTENPFLGNLSPLDMINLGLMDKLFKFIKNAISENGA